ncbi:DUF3040 domain-containing protein [Streptomyces caeni]|uniref:DUF3040 domain-containing protein n=1 Tax=Streptomyces caeni TaxID=2307231 RepID=A0ABW4IWD2_9ACTN
MNPSMDDRHILAEMERRLSRDDPELATLLQTLNRQFTDSQDDTGSGHDDSGARFDWRWKAGIALAIVAMTGLLLAALVTASPPADDNHGPLSGHAAAASVADQATPLTHPPV